MRRFSRVLMLIWLHALVALANDLAVLRATP